MDQPIYGEDGWLQKWLIWAGALLGACFAAVALTSGVVVGRQRNWPLLIYSVVLVFQLATTFLLSHWYRQETLDPKFRYLIALLVGISILMMCNVLMFAYGVHCPGEVCGAYVDSRFCMDTTNPTWCLPAPPDCFWDLNSCVVNKKCGVITGASPGHFGRSINYTCTV